MDRGYNTSFYRETPHLPRLRFKRGFTVYVCICVMHLGKLFWRAHTVSATLKRPCNGGRGWLWRRWVLGTLALATLFIGCSRGCLAEPFDYMCSVYPTNVVKEKAHLSLSLSVTCSPSCTIPPLSLYHIPSVLIARPNHQISFHLWALSALLCNTDPETVSGVIIHPKVDHIMCDLLIGLWPLSVVSTATMW